MCERLFSVTYIIPQIINKRILVIATIILFATSGFSQDQEYVDSLKAVIDSSPEDSLKVNALIDLASQYYRTAAPKAIELGTQARDLALEIKYQSGLGYAYKAIGMGYYFINNYLEAVLNWQQALATLGLVQ